MKKLILTLVVFFSLISCSLASNTYYVHIHGGTPSQCTGLSDKDYTPVISDITHDCAFSHPFWAIAPQGNNPTKMVGGDTLIVDNIDPATNKQAQYMIGYGAPNTGDTSKCSQWWPWDCISRPIPSGPDAQHPTRILGKTWDSGCATPAQLWGTQHLGQILNLSGSNNVEVQCIEVTDHSDCQQSGPNACNRDTNNGPTNPYGLWAATGLYAQDSSNVLLNNFYSHGLYNGVQAGRIKDWTIQNFRLIANSSSNWQGDLGGTTSSNSGTIHFINGIFDYSGCGERLDGTPYNCYSQSQTPGGYGDALGEAKTGGNWIFDNVKIMHSTQDGLDLLYHDGTGTVTINGGYYGHNSGNQIKTATKTILNNVQVEGDCNWFKGQSVTYSPSNFDYCRARGNSVVVAFGVVGQTVTINGGSVNGVGDSLLMTAGTNCNGTESFTTNGTTLVPQTKFFDSSSKSSLFYNSGDSLGNGGGPCGNIKFIQTAINPVPINTCVSNGSCSAATPACGQTTTGLDNCNNPCTLVGQVCCVPDGSCSAATPACGTTTTGVNNCGAPCSKVGATCPVVCPPVVVCPAPTVCPVCPAPVVCGDPTVNSVTVNISSNGKSYSITK